MTREEQIHKVASTYLTGNYDLTVSFIESFEDGAKWADANPKSPWISVEDDLPCNHKELMQNQHYTKKVLVILAWDDNPAKRHIELCDMCSKVYPCNTNWRWRQPTYYHVTHWMPLPELPTKE